MSKITIYTNETCPYCKQVKEELKKNNIEFNNKLTSVHQEEWAKINDLTGMPTVPTLKIEKTYLVPARDFGSPQHLISIIKNFKESEYRYNYRTFERIKTLNYNIQMAFGRTDKILRQIENKLNTNENKK
jgi:glutaredoxin